MQYTGVYTATFRQTAMATAVTLVEVTASTDSPVALLHAWISPRGLVLDQIQEVNLFINDAAGTGTALTPEPMHEGYAAFGGTARRTITAEGTTPTDWWEDGFHFQNGFTWPPIPEMFKVIQPSSIIGMRLPVAPDASMGIAFGLVIAEYG